MKFADLIFDKTGCCGTHAWSEVRHDNGKVSSVYDNSDGTYSVVTHAAGMLMRGQESYTTEDGVMTRLSEDAA